MGYVLFPFCSSSGEGFPVFFLPDVNLDLTFSRLYSLGTLRRSEVGLLPPLSPHT